MIKKVLLTDWTCPQAADANLGWSCRLLQSSSVICSAPAMFPPQET